MSGRTALVITVACLSGGSGKTTAALNLAIMLAEHGKTLAVDFDPQGNLSQWMGWTDLSESATIAETILPGRIGFTFGRLSVRR
jgi:chromosome partitioning protein